MKMLAVFMLAFICLATSEKLSYRDGLENIQDRLEKSQITEREEAPVNETEEQELGKKNLGTKVSWFYLLKEDWGLYSISIKNK